LTGVADQVDARPPWGEAVRNQEGKRSMGPTNVALVKLFEADRTLRDAQHKLEDAAHNIRIQERRVNDLTEKLRLAQHTHKDQLSKTAQLELDLKIRDQQIEKLRAQQQLAKNNKEYQALLVEINTRKLDRGKIEEQTLALVDAAEKVKVESAALSTHLETEKEKLVVMKAQVGDTLTKLQAEIDAVRPQREAAEAVVPPKARDIFNRLADRYDGEAMAGIDRPDRRKEEYLCTACNMDLVRDIYNKLKSRDDVVFCPNCQRILFIPDHFTAEHAIGGPGKPTAKRKPTVRVSKTGTKKSGAAAKSEVADQDVVVIEARATGELGRALSSAQGESVSRAVKSDSTPVECEVHVDGKLAGIYKGISVENLERAIKYFMGDRKVGYTSLVVTPTVQPAAAPSEIVPAAAAPEAASSGTATETDAAAPAATAADGAEASQAVEPSESASEPATASGTNSPT
jgi:predicted  nucleic acid-binding Zn-ribbon protein